MTVINQLDDNETLWAAELNALANAHGAGGIISGCSISKGTGDWDIDVTSGQIIESNTEASISSGTVTITDSSALTSGQSRVTLIHADTGDALDSTDGTAAADPASPDIPDGEVLLGFVVVANGDSTVADSDIFDIPATRQNDSALYDIGGSHDLKFGTKSIESQSPSGVSSADFTTGIDSDHSTYIFEIADIVPASDGVRLDVQVTNDGGSNWIGGTNYDYAVHLFDTGGTEPTENATGQSAIALTGSHSIGSAAGEGAAATVRLSDPANGGLTQYFRWDISYTVSDGDHAIGNGVGVYTTAEAIDGVRFQFSSGNIESGTIELRGVN